MARLRRFVNKTDLMRKVNGNNRCENKQTLNWSAEGNVFGNILEMWRLGDAMH